MPSTKVSSTSFSIAQDAAAIGQLDTILTTRLVRWVAVHLFQTDASSPTVSRDSARLHAFFKFSCFQLNLLVKAEKGDLSTFVTNGEWHLLGEIVISVCIVQIQPNQTNNRKKPLQTHKTAKRRKLNLRGAKILFAEQHIIKVD